jgi:hypothetical protein
MEWQAMYPINLSRGSGSSAKESLNTIGLAIGAGTYGKGA